MNNMMFSMYACDIRDVLKHVKEESLEILVDNAVRYIKRNTKYFSTCNWIAQELFFDVIPDELIGEIFNKKVYGFWIMYFVLMIRLEPLQFIV